MMEVLKRVEVWVLLILVAGGVVFVLVTQRPSLPEGPPPAEAVVETEKAAPFEVEGATLRRESADHWVLELAVSYRNDSGAELELVSPTAQLLTREGVEIPAFFLAFAPPPMVPAHSKGKVELFFWLNEEWAEEELWLKILEDRVKVDLKDGNELVRNRDPQGKQASR